MSAQEDAVIEAVRMAAGEQAVVDWLARCVDQHRNAGDIIEAAMALGVKALIERLRKERDDAIKAMDKPDEVIEMCAKIADAEGLSPNASVSYCAAAFHIGMCIRALKNKPLNT